MNTIEHIKTITNQINIRLFDLPFDIRVEYDNKYSREMLKYTSGRIFIQIQYKTRCTKTRKLQQWSGRKWYLSSHMTEDEIIKTCYSAFKTAVEHEVMEGFKVNNIILFNPHINYKELLKISNKEIKRK